MPPRARRLAWMAAIHLVVAVVSFLPVDLTAQSKTGRGVKPTPSGRGPLDPYRKRIALVVGIDRYTSGIDSLEYAVEDARSIGRMLETRYGFEVRRLENEQATRESLIETIIGLQGETGPDDELLVFFAGHGISFGEGAQEIGYILPSGVAGSGQDRVWLSGMPMDELVGHLVRLPPKHLLILLDTCYSGYAAMRPRGAIGGDAEQLLRRLTAQPGRHLLYAGKRGERAYESSDWKHSAFAAELLLALGEGRANHNRDGLITVSELYSDLLPAVLKRSHGAQTPKLSPLDDGDGEFVFLQAPSRSDPIAGVPPPTAIPRPEGSAPLAMTSDRVQKKAIIGTHDARLFTNPSGAEGKKIDFMQILFLLEGGSGTRVPVSFSPGKQYPDGWLERNTFIEWNTRQMLKFEPQQGRDLLKIFEDAGCANSFGLLGKAGHCEVLGNESTSIQQDQGHPLFVPVLKSDRDTYQGAFLRVAPRLPAVPAGLDLILVVDSTAGMGAWFKPTAQALDAFIDSVRSQIVSGGGKVPFRIGLLFFRDRKTEPDCDIGYLFHWESDLSANVQAVSRALHDATEASCGSDEEEAAVYDALSRAAQDPSWSDGNFKIVFLIGDAPPHPPRDRDKNPLGLDVDDIVMMFGERNIRLLTLKIGFGGANEFRALALTSKESTRGRFRAVEKSPAAFRSAFLAMLQEDWRLLTDRNKLVEASIDADKFDILIILTSPPPGSVVPEFVQGWAPKRIKQKLALVEYIFIEKQALLRFINVIEGIALSAESGISDGGESFIHSLRMSIAAQLKVQPEDLFRSGESLESMMQKADVLPFKSTFFSFTAEEVNAWRPADFARLNKILADKVSALREYAQKPGNAHIFGDKPMLYVPRDLLP
jgi:caspase domain-containing protein